ncbi:MAG: HAMP domain-containing histidine kinase [Candidatus Obscuribacterales bacterium]|nr:HAMP domain-containing histidine kinase [Candidatus Obscuribacterales bacterium]
MRIRHQGAILLGIPLLCQIVFAVVLTRNIALLDDAGRKEARAKLVISSCQEIRGVGARVMMGVMGRQLFSDPNGTSVKQAIDNVVSHKFQAVEDLVSDDPTSLKLVQKYKRDVGKLGEVLADFGTIMDDTNTPAWADRKNLLLARYLNEQEQMEEALVRFQHCVDDEETLIKRFTPILEEWRPKALAERKNLRNTVIAGVTVETLLFIGIALFMGKTLIGRLAVLMKNIDRFSAGQPVTETLTGNDELTELNTKFREMAAARYEAEEFKRNLMSMVAHDLRSPLASANLTIDVILHTREAELDDWVKKRLGRLDSELRRLFRLANSLLDVEKIESNKLELDLAEHSPEEIIDATKKALEGSAAAKNISLRQDITTTTKLTCDKERLIQVLVNLVSNSLKFAPKDSTVTLRVTSREEAGELRFAVIDQGPGVPEEDRSKLFQKFSQLDQEMEIKKQGSGFGLYLTGMIVRAHNGRAGYERAGEESVFFFDLPTDLKPDPN